MRRWDDRPRAGRTTDTHAVAGVEDPTRSAWRDRAIGPEDRFEETPYLPLRARESLGLAEVLYDGVRLRRSLTTDNEWLTEWLSHEAIYAPLGFPLPIGPAFIERSAAPDLTGSAEPVEYLIAEELATRRPIGFVMCYEAHRPGDPDQEVDFALPLREFGTPEWIRPTRTCLLTHLFCLCGARSVSWVRMRKGRSDAPVGGSEAGGFRARGAEHHVGPAEYRRILRQIGRSRPSSEWPRVRVPAEAGPAAVNRNDSGVGR